MIEVYVWASSCLLHIWVMSLVCMSHVSCIYMSHVSYKQRAMSLILPKFAVRVRVTIIICTLHISYVITSILHTSCVYGINHMHMAYIICTLRLNINKHKKRVPQWRGGVCSSRTCTCIGCQNVFRMHDCIATRTLRFAQPTNLCRISTSLAMAVLTSAVA